MAENHSFIPGKDPLLYAQAVFGEEEIRAVTQCLEDGWLGAGKLAAIFEERVAKLFGQTCGLFVNSGSSANLLAVETLGLPEGSEVITPACTFATTINPLLQNRLVPVLVDVEENTYNANLDLVEEAITSKTSALMIPHLVGNLSDVKRLRSIADKYNLGFIEDSCDTIGATLNGEPTGKYADATTTSFYASHIITAAGGGGMVMLKNPGLAVDAKIRRDWGRALPEDFDDSPDKRFVFSLDGVPHDGKFIFNQLGYNFKPIEIQAAFALVQLVRLPEFSRTRKKNFSILKDFCAQYPEHFILPHELPGADTNWLAFPVNIKKDSPIKRAELMQYLEDRKIQTRVLFSGNITRHPAYKNANWRIHGELPASDHILAQCMLIGCHHGLNDKHMEYLTETLGTFIRAKI